MSEHDDKKRPLRQEITPLDIQHLVSAVTDLVAINVENAAGMRALLAALHPKKSFAFHMDLPGLPGALGDRSPTATELQCYLLGIKKTLQTDDVEQGLDSDNIRNVYSELGLPSIDCQNCNEPSIFTLCENVRGKWYCTSCANHIKR